MIRKYSLGLLIAAAMISCGGCYPYHFTTEPGAKGRVYDGRTHAPLTGVKVKASAGGRETVTAKDGSFVIPGKQEWSIGSLLPIDYIPYEGRVELIARGYVPAERAFHSSPTGPATTDLGNIELERQTRGR